MSSYLELRKKQSKDFAEEIRKKFQDQQPEKRDPTAEDPTFWSPNHVRGEDGNGYAVFRWLPAPEGEDDPWVSWYEHIFQGAEHWYSNRSRISLGANERDPVYEYNGKIFKDKSLNEAERKKRLLPRKQNFVANIYMIEDEKRPENNGKVFKFKYGPQIHNINQAAMFPKFKNIKAINPFDPFEGHNFVFRVITKKIGTAEVPSYDESSYEPMASSLVDKPEDFDAIWAQEHSLQAEVAQSKYKPYKELSARFKLVMGEITKEEYDELVEGDAGTVMEPKQKPAEESRARRAPAERPAEAPATSAKSLKEEMDDDIPPFDTTTTSAAEAADDDDDDWFNNLKR